MTRKQLMELKQYAPSPNTHTHTPHAHGGPEGWVVRPCLQGWPGRSRKTLAFEALSKTGEKQAGASAPRGGIMPVISYATGPGQLQCDSCHRS